MKYMGSKTRIAKYILPVILKDRKPNQWYVEPFVGGANLIDKVPGFRIGADCNKHLIDALILIRDNLDLLPKNNKEFTENDYKNVKTGNEYHWLKDYCGFALSYAGKWFGVWCRDGAGKRDYVAEAYRNSCKQSPKIQGVIFKKSDYTNLEIPENSIIYCDPPYVDTTKYKNNFNHDEFWQWCRDKSKEGYKVFISEYNAPEDFECIWSKEICSNLDRNTGAKRGIEKLFIYRG